LNLEGLGKIRKYMKLLIFIIISSFFNTAKAQERKLEPQWSYPILSLGRTVINNESANYSSLGYRKHHGNLIWTLETTSTKTELNDFKGYGGGLGYYMDLNKSVEPYALIGAGMASINDSSGVYNFVEVGAESRSKGLLAFIVGYRVMNVEAEVGESTRSNTLFIGIKANLFRK